VRVDESRPSPGLPVLGNDAQDVDLGLLLSVRWGSHSALRRWSNCEDRQKHRRDGQPAAHLAIRIGSYSRPLIARIEDHARSASLHVAFARREPGQSKRGKVEDERCQPVALVMMTVAGMRRRLVPSEPRWQRVGEQSPLGDCERDESDPVGHPVARSNRPAGPQCESLGSEQPPADQPAGPAAVTAASGEWGMTARQAAQAPPRPAQARSLSTHGGALDERKRWPQCPSSLVERGLSSKRQRLSMRGVARIVRSGASRPQTLTTGALVRAGRASAKGSSSRSSVISRLTFLRMTARAAPPSTDSAARVAAPMPSQNHTGTVILSASRVATKPTIECGRTSFE
jgi:hypothetical protein